MQTVCLLRNLKKPHTIALELLGSGPGYDDPSGKNVDNLDEYVLKAMYTSLKPEKEKGSR